MPRPDHAQARHKGEEEQRLLVLHECVSWVTLLSDPSADLRRPLCLVNDCLSERNAWTRSRAGLRGSRFRGSGRHGTREPVGEAFRTFPEWSSRSPKNITRFTVSCCNWLAGAQALKRAAPPFAKLRLDDLRPVQKYGRGSWRRFPKHDETKAAPCPKTPSMSTRGTQTLHSNPKHVQRTTSLLTRKWQDQIVKWALGDNRLAHGLLRYQVMAGPGSRRPEARVSQRRCNRE